MRRNRVPGGSYFFTVVTEGRRPLFAQERWRSLLGNAIRNELAVRSWTPEALVLLPDHLHTIWTLPPGDTNYSLRWKRIKEEFTKVFLAEGGVEADIGEARRSRRERGVWQHRFWEHTVRDEDDLKRCLDYLHWNPVKHGLVSRVRDYQWSTFGKYVEMGEYDRNWGCGADVSDIPGAEWD